MMPTLAQQIQVLLADAKLSTQIDSIVECAKGGNNRTYKVTTPEGNFAVKQYFRRGDDQRDRLSAEFSFLCYAREVARQFVPQAFSQNPETGLALYEFISGQACKANEITAIDIDQASQFFCELNDVQRKLQAMHLPLASESCFSIQAHLDLISQRILQLKNNASETEQDHTAKKLILELENYWQQLLTKINNLVSRRKIDLIRVLSQEERCISPSDFGFHNALRLTNGELRFIDFEYAGWDDPAKMVGDFFAQLAVPVADDFFYFFMDSILQVFKDKEFLLQRAQIMHKVYQVKWCCIALNIFLPVHLARRQFANPNLDIIALKETQIKKVGNLLEAFSALPNF